MDEAWKLLLQLLHHVVEGCDLSDLYLWLFLVHVDDFQLASIVSYAGLTNFQELGFIFVKICTLDITKLSIFSNLMNEIAW